MPDPISDLPARPSLEHLRKQAKDLLRDYRAGVPDAAQRLGAIGLRPDSPQDMTLADAQLALAREYGFASWPKLAHHIAGLQPSGRLEPFAELARDLVAACASDDAAALKRVNDVFGRSLTLGELRAQVARRLAALVGGDSNFALADVQLFIARQYGFARWAELAESVAQPPGEPPSTPHGLSSSPPFYRIDWRTRTIHLRPPLSEGDWDTIFDVMREHRISGLNAGGLMTDNAMERLSRLDHVTHLNLDGTKRLTDDGLLHLARMPQLQELDLSDYPGGRVTDRGLAVLRHLTGLRRLQMCWQAGVTDAGVAGLSHCENLECVNLLGTPTGDGAIAALAGKGQLRQLKAGSRVTAAGLALLHEIPRFKVWHGGEPSYALMKFEAEPTYLLVSPVPFAHQGLDRLLGLEGLFALNIDGPVQMTAGGLAPVTQLPNLGWLGVDPTDNAMEHIAAMPRLRMLMCQDTNAADDGFVALGQSRSIEYIWGRKCYGLSARGFAALAAMPALRGLAVSCKNVDDAALSLLPQFPALRELMPMDVPDAGFRHVGRCERLQELWCMYCRDTGDVATSHITGLSGLKSYYAGLTQITDESLKILGRLQSLERVELHHCLGISDAGIAHLAGLPRLHELRISNSPNVTRGGIAVVGDGVHVSYEA